MATYLVTGGAGFIGSNLVKELVKRQETVKVVDNLSLGKLANLKEVMDKITFIEGDICDLELMEKTCKGVDYVLHQAALPSVPRSLQDPLASNKNNVEGTLTVLVAARDNGVKRVTYAASSSAYGDIEGEFKSEEMPANPKSPYALTKYAGEVYAQQFTKLFGLETVCLRYFNVFGPNQDPNSQYAAVIPNFIRLILKGEAPTIYGDGEQSRDFTYVANNVEANILAANAKTGAGEVINIACGESTTLNQLVDLINEELGTNVKPIYEPARAGDIKHSKARIDKAKQLIGYEPLVDFKQGLRETILWYKKNLA